MHRSHSQGLERDGNELFFILYHAEGMGSIHRSTVIIGRGGIHFWEAMGIGVLEENAISAYEREIKQRKTNQRAFGNGLGLLPQDHGPFRTGPSLIHILLAGY